jgi:hypothetical protein
MKELTPIHIKLPAAQVPVRPKQEVKSEQSILLIVQLAPAN